MSYVLKFVFVSLFLVSFSGCQTMGYQLFHPGTHASQRARIMEHDLYPDADAGPEVVGGRPREFQKQRPETIRNRWQSDYATPQGQPMLPF